MKDKEMGSSSAAEHTSPDGLTEAQRSAGLASFARGVLAALWDGYDLDGGDIQELAEKHGLIRGVPFDPDIHTDYLGVGAGPGDLWYTEERWLKALACPAESGARSPSEASAATSVADEPNTSSLLARVAELEGALRLVKAPCCLGCPDVCGAPYATNDIGAPPELCCVLRTALIGEE